MNAKKFDKGQDIWQGRVNDDWRFYFHLAEDGYEVVSIVPHPK